tara:strand:- start:3959 stop:4258 length:300 start_codon:yes stop_codon:yes gene_type:complete
MWKRGVAQLVEQRTFNPLVAGSIPVAPTKEERFMKKFKRGDLVEYDFALGLVLETGPRSDGSKRNDYYDACRVMFCDGIEWKETRHLHEPGPYLKRNKK